MKQHADTAPTATAGPPAAPDVLIVDPNEAAAEMLVALLIEEKLTAAAVAGGRAALAFVADHRPGVAVVDAGLLIKQGGMAAVQLASALQQLEPPVPVLLLGGHGHGRLTVNFRDVPVLERGEAVPLLEAIRGVLDPPPDD